MLPVLLATPLGRCCRPSSPHQQHPRAFGSCCFLQGFFLGFSNVLKPLFRIFQVLSFFCELKAYVASHESCAGRSVSTQTCSRHLHLSLDTSPAHGNTDGGCGDSPRRGTQWRLRSLRLTCVHMRRDEHGCVGGGCPRAGRTRVYEARVCVCVKPRHKPQFICSLFLARISRASNRKHRR